MKKYFNYYLAIYKEKKEKKLNMQLFFTKKEAENWLKGKGDLRMITTWETELNKTKAREMFEAYAASIKEGEK